MIMASSGERDDRRLAGTAALDVLLDFLERDGRTDEAEFEQLCVRRPEIADELRKLRRCRGGGDTSAGPTGATRTLWAWIQRIGRPQIRGARFQRESVIGRGGMGVVHRVRD